MQRSEACCREKENIRGRKETGNHGGGTNVAHRRLYKGNLVHNMVG